MTNTTTNQATTSQAQAQAIPQLPIPPNINAAQYDFAGTKPLRFDRSGALSPVSKNQMAKIDWNNLQRPVQSKYNDAHCHMHQYDGTGHAIAHVVKASEEIGIDHFTLTPIPTTLVSTKNDQEKFKLYQLSHHCGEHYYVPAHLSNIENLSKKILKEIQQTHELRVDPSVDDNLIHQIYAAVKNGQIEPKHLDKMDPALTGIHLGSPRVTKDILQTLWRTKNTSGSLAEHLKQHHGAEAAKQHRLRFSLIGEVTLNKELVETLFAGKSQANLKTNIAPTREAMRLAGVIGLPWVLHCDVDKPESLKEEHEKGKPAKHLEDVKSLLRSCPNTEIIWAHAGGLGRFVLAGPEHVNEMRKLMEDPTLSHVKLDISWSMVAKQLTQSEDTVGKWARFLCDFKDRILFGSDTLTPQTSAKWTETYDMYKDKLIDEMNKIDPSASEQILKDNYKKVIIDARPRVDAFVDHVLPEIIHGMQHLAGVENVDVKALKTKRDQVFAEKAATHPELNAVIDHFASRDTSLDAIDHMEQLQKTITDLTQANAARTIQNRFRSNTIAQQKDEIARLQAQNEQLQKTVQDQPQQMQKEITDLTQTNAARTIQNAFRRGEIAELKKEIAKFEKPRNHKLLKGLGNMLTAGQKFKNYQLGSDKDGDYLKTQSFQNMKTRLSGVLHAPHPSGESSIQHSQGTSTGESLQDSSVQQPKQRNHKLLKGLGNLVTAGQKFKNYQLGSGKDGDYLKDS